MGDYVYWNGSFWVYSTSLPYAYAGFDLYNANIVFLSIGVTYPWHYHSYYVADYPVYYFVGVNYYSTRHGWRFYDENGIGFHGPHKSVKYNLHYNVQNHYKGGREKFKYDYAQHRNKKSGSPGTSGKKENRDFEKVKPERKDFSPEKKQDRQFKKEEGIKKDVQKEQPVKKYEQPKSGTQREIKGTQQKKQQDVQRKSPDIKKQSKPAPTQGKSKKGGGGKGSE